MGAAVYQWCDFKSCRWRIRSWSAQKSNSNTVGLNFQYIYIRTTKQATVYMNTRDLHPLHDIFTK
jgi:hypothetical protein